MAHLNLPASSLFAFCHLLYSGHGMPLGLLKAKETVLLPSPL